MLRIITDDHTLTSGLREAINSGVVFTVNNVQYKAVSVSKECQPVYPVLTHTPPNWQERRTPSEYTITIEALEVGDAPDTLTHGTLVYIKGKKESYSFIGWSLHSHKSGDRIAIIERTDIAKTIRITEGKLTTAKPVVYQDGDWWVCSYCELLTNKPFIEHPLLRLDGEWHMSEGHKIPSGAVKVIPLYRLVKDKE